MVLREQNQTGEARCDVELRNGASEDAAVEILSRINKKG